MSNNPPYKGIKKGLVQVSDGLKILPPVWLLRTNYLVVKGSIDTMSQKCKKLIDGCTEKYYSKRDS